MPEKPCIVTLIFYILLYRIVNCVEILSYWIFYVCVLFGGARLKWENKQSTELLNYVWGFFSAVMHDFIFPPPTSWFPSNEI